MPKAISKSPKKKQSKGKSVASSNWLNFLKSRASKPNSHKKKRKKVASSPLSVDEERVASTSLLEHVGSSSSGYADENSRASLRSMALLALGDKFSDEQRLPGQYVSLDCEMVGVGIKASESSLARVSLVNYYGAVIVDEYVKQREHVVDYRTRWSGIRASDMINAKPFEEVQKTVNDLLDGRILIGHAVHNDLKVLLLSQPSRQVRDTQKYAYKFGLCRTRSISLKNLAKQELGIDIQTGEHSSVVDARATMAIYRMHKKDWENPSGKTSGPYRKSSKQVSAMDPLKAAMNSILEKQGVAEPPPTSNIHRKKGAKKNGPLPGGGRKGVSSGLSTVVRHGKEPSKDKPWWKSVTDDAHA
jgi:RNA exonuclease 4